MPEDEEAKEQVEITGPDGEVMPDEEAQEFLKRLQAGVFYFSQK